VTGCRFVHDHKAEFRVTDLCRLIELSRSSYYAWVRFQPSQRELEDNELFDHIIDIHTRSRRTYGAPRVWGQLRNRDLCVGRHRVARIKAEHGLVGVHGRKKWRRGRVDVAPAPDLLQRDFAALGPDERWVADLSEFHCLDGKLFLAGIHDLFDKTLVGWSMGERQTTDLVVSALVMALSRRSPDKELVHHSDKGSQYTSLEFANRLAAWNITASFGSTGDTYDNAAMETFWAAAKREIEFLHGPVKHKTRSQLRTIIFDYVEIFYNRERHQAALGHRTPAEVYEAAMVA
jgi:transposase InsO family protein